jgi:hypothetical protein
MAASSGSEMDASRRDDELEMCVEADGGGGGSIIRSPPPREDLEMFVKLPLFLRVWWLLEGLTVDAISWSSSVMDRGEDE